MQSLPRVAIERLLVVGQTHGIQTPRAYVRRYLREQEPLILGSLDGAGGRPGPHVFFDPGGRHSPRDRTAP